MRYVLMVVATLLVTGCRMAGPQWIQGNYYMAGDSRCVRGQISYQGLECYDRQGTFTEYRRALTPEEVQNYQVQTQQLQDSIHQAGQSWANAGQQIRNQSQQYQAPQVQPIAPQTPNVTTYYRSGSSWVGTDGSTCQIIGESIYCSEGRKCRAVGDNLICN